VIETAQSGVQTFNAIMQLQKNIDQKLKKLGIRSGDARKVTDYLYTKPIIDATKIGEIIEKTPRSVYKLITSLVELGIIREITGAQRGRIYAFHEYLDLFTTKKK